jgi:SulP family sulfate permease
MQLLVLGILAGATRNSGKYQPGGTTRLSGSSMFVLLVLLGALAAYTPILYWLVLIPVGFNIIDWKALKHLRIIPKSDAVVLINCTAYNYIWKSYLC